MTRSLDGRRIVVCRSVQQATGLTRALEQRGAEVVAVPLIETVPPDDGGDAIARAADRLHEFDWLVLTSTNALRALSSHAPAPTWPSSLRVVAVGPATERAAEEMGATVDLVPSRATASDLADAMPAGPGRVLVPQAALADDQLERALGGKGFDVERIVAYDTVAPTPSAEQLSRAGRADAVILTAPSVVDRFVALDTTVPPVVACIGPRTAARADAAGLTGVVVADPHTDDGLVAVIVRTLGV